MGGDGKKDQSIGAYEKLSIYIREKKENCECFITAWRIQKMRKKIFSMELCTTLEIKCFMPIIFKGVLSIVKATILHVSLHIHGIVNYNFFLNFNDSRV